MRCSVDCAVLVCARPRLISFPLQSLLALRLPDSDLAEFRTSLSDNLPLLIVLEEGLLRALSFLALEFPEETK